MTLLGVPSFLSVPSHCSLTGPVFAKRRQSLATPFNAMKLRKQSESYFCIEVLKANSHVHRREMRIRSILVASHGAI